MEGIGLYQLYCSIKAHCYSKKYDMVKYNYKLNLSEESFNKRNDRGLFNALAYSSVIKNKTKADIVDFFMAIFKSDGNIHVSKIVTNVLEYDKLWKKHNAVITDYVNKGALFIRDLTSTYIDTYMSFTKDFYNNRPKIFHDIRYSSIFLESGIILNLLSKGKIFELWDQCEDTDLKKYIKFYKKYQLYLADKINIEMYKNKFREWLNHNA